MNEFEKIRLVAKVLLEARKRGWMFITFPNFKQEINLEKNEVIEVLDLLKKGKIFNYEFMPFDNWNMKKSIFDKDDNIQDATGSISFFPIKALNKEQLEKFKGGINWKELTNIVASDEALESFLNRILYKPVVSFDEDRHAILFKNYVIEVSVGNESIFCKTLFLQSLGTRVRENDIASSFDEKDKYKGNKNATYHVIYNTKEAINRKFEKQTGIKKLIEFKNGGIWAEINPLKK